MNDTKKHTDDLDSTGEENPINNSEYFAFVDNIEIQEDGRSIIQFDSIHIHQIDKFDRDILTSEEIQLLQPSMILCDFTKNIYEEFKAIFEEEFVEGNWLLLNVTATPTQFPVNYIPEYESGPPSMDTRYLLREGCTKVNDGNKRKLRKIFQIQEQEEEFINWTRNFKIDIILKEDPRIDVSNFDVVVYNVGQGSMNAILDENGYPVAYFDVGGGAYWNADTYPSQNIQNLCFKKQPIFILSHWHYDHWWTFNRLIKDHSIPKGLKTTWIVPKQDIGPIQSKFYHLLKLYHHNILICSDRVTCYFRFGEVLKTYGLSKNNSGLILKVTIGEERILLPGDASYEYIPMSEHEAFTGIVATHHGGKCTDDLNQFPKSKNESGKIVYSYGLNNTYGHPSQNSKNNHIKAGWSNIKKTITGTVSFKATSDQIELNIASSKYGLGNDCGYDIEQGF